MSTKDSKLTGTKRALENSAEDLERRYADYAVAGVVHPSIEGSPLIEFSASGRVFYLFDRNGLYEVQPGPRRILIHGILDMQQTVLTQPSQHAQLNPDNSDSEQLVSSGISELQGYGRLVAIQEQHWVVQARVQLLLSSFEALPTAQVGDWLQFATLAPLHGFAVAD